MSKENKARDDKFLNCSEEHELDYVADKYEERDKVYEFLKAKCADKTIKYSSHDEVYALIEKELGFKLD